MVESNGSIVEPLVNLLQSLHIEVQYEAIELIRLLMDYSVKEALIKSLVNVLRPPKKHERSEVTDCKKKADNIFNKVNLCLLLIKIYIYSKGRFE